MQSNNDLRNAKEFWRQLLKGFTSPTPLVVDGYPRGITGNKHQNGEQLTRLEATSTVALDTFIAAYGLTLEVCVQGAWAILLSRYSGNQDVVFGLAAPDRADNTMPVCVRVSPLEPTLRWLKQLQQQQIELGRYNGVSLAQICNWCNIPRGAVLFESVLIQGEADGHSQAKIAESALVVAAIAGSELTLQIRFDRGRFEAATIDRMLGHFKTLLGGMVADPEQPLSTLPLLTKQERQELLFEWNHTQAPYPRDACLHQLFERQVKQAPDARAIVYRDERVAYADLNDRANQLARYLRSLGVDCESLVGICMERSIEMVVGILGILKAGAAYVPMEPTYPKERLAFMLAETRVPILLTQEPLSKELPRLEARIICLDTEWKTIAEQSVEATASAVNAENLAYVIYTSGSTGTPKGIALRHRGVVNNLVDLNQICAVGRDDRVLCISSLGFDMCVYEILGTLAAGGTIVMPEATAVKDPAHWAELVARHRITVWNSAPALLDMFVSYTENRPELRPRTIRVAILGGDWVPLALPTRLKALAKRARVIVLGGATESSIHSTVYEVEEIQPAWKSIPYGRPMANQQTYILDPYLQPVPIGVAGELHLGGVGLARGYFGRPELTAEKFIPHPFSDNPGDRVYKTGDLARWMPDGNIELLGRLDFQIKVRGHRIELEEIIAALKEHPAVQEAIVLAIGEKFADKRLVAYVVQDPQFRAPEEQIAVTISQWQKVYDETYAQPTLREDPTLNDIGWISSYTGEPIAESESREQVNHTVQEILALRPKRVIEMGCGTGMLLLRIAPHCTQYLGADLSQTALRDLKPKLTALNLSNVVLMHGQANDFSEIDADSLDTVILNSVVQHFPSIDYLLQVLEGAVNATAPGGHIYVGDLFSLPLLEMFHTSVQFYQAPPTVTRSQLQHRVTKHVFQEGQLFIDPALFIALRSHLPKISHVQVTIKRGRYHNEMTRFRYNVVLHIGSVVDYITDCARLDWQNQALTLSSVRKVLVEDRPEFLAIEDVPNVRLLADVKVKQWLKSLDGRDTVSTMRRVLQDTRQDIGVDPEDFWALGDKLPYSINISWSASGATDHYDVFFRRQHTELSPSSIDLIAFHPGEVNHKPWGQYGNNPLQGELDRVLAPQLRRLLQERLPQYMVPSAFVLLDRLPLTPNGKVDRRALPMPDETRPELATEFLPTRTPVEQVIAGIWSDVLSIERVGIHDNFFELGGHSLTATQVIARSSEAFHISVPLQTIFEQPTVAGLAESIADLGVHANVDVIEVAKILIQVDELSESEVRTMLEARSGRE